MSFFKKHEVKLLPNNAQEQLSNNLANLETDTQHALSHFDDLNLAKKRAKNIRHESLKNLDSYLIHFERHINEKKGKVFWAQDAAEAIKKILKLIKQTQPKSIFTGNASELQEIELEGVLHDEKIDFHSTEIGQFLLRYLRKKSRHPVHHLIGESEARFVKILKEVFEIEDTPNSPPVTLRELLDKYKQEIIKDYQFPAMSITNADFLLADSGGIFVTDNQGSQTWLTSCSNIQIVVAGIERILPSLKDLQDILPLYTTYHYGKLNNNFNTLSLGPLQGKEIDGPTQLYVILLDNGRTSLLNSEWREMLYDIESPNFLSSCPIYRNLHERHYHAQFAGVAGAILTPVLYDDERYMSLPFFHLTEQDDLYNLYNIEVEKMLLKTRKQVLDQNTQSKIEQYLKTQIKNALLDRKNTDKLTSNIRGFLFQKAFQQVFPNDTKLPKFAKTTFHDWWTTNNK